MLKTVLFFGVVNLPNNSPENDFNLKKLSPVCRRLFWQKEDKDSEEKRKSGQKK